MSTASLPSYVGPSLNGTPAYTVEPQAFEQRLAFSNNVRPRPTGNFVKESKNGGFKLRLNAQEENATLPMYGTGGDVQGTVEISKPEGVHSVEVKIEGRLLLHEIAEGGTTTAKLCLDSVKIWTKTLNDPVCPASLPFSLRLPSTFQFDGRTYPLPPTFYVKLSGLPGFKAYIDYSVTATFDKSHVVPKLTVKSKALNIGTTTISTPFIYHPRTRPAVALPVALQISSGGFDSNSDWKTHQSVMRSRSPGGHDISVKLYIPSSRVFCISEPIPFHLTFQSSAMSLVAFLPFSPTAHTSSNKPKVTRMQLMRQSTVDVRNAMTVGAKTEIWRVDNIGEGTFRHTGEGPTWISFSGVVNISNTVKVSGFRAAGLSVKDCLVLSVNPPDPARSPFGELRQVIPVHLTTDPWTPDGTGIGSNLHRDNGSISSLPTVQGYVDSDSD